MQTSGASRRENADTHSSVIVREGGRSSIPETLMMESISRGVLDCPAFAEHDNFSVRICRVVALSFSQPVNSPASSVFIGWAERSATPSMSEGVTMGIASHHPSYAPESFSSRAKWLRSLGTAKSMKARTFGTVSRPCGTITCTGSAAGSWPASTISSSPFRTLSAT